LSPIIVFPGAGGRIDNPATFTSDGNLGHVQAIRYPGWHRYISNGFTAKGLEADLAAQVIEIVPRGPICIVGYSIGGHFGYAAALHLQALGREIGGFCAIDTFMTRPADLSPGWHGRSVARSLELLSQGRIREFTRFPRLLFWRTLFKIPRGQLPSLLLRLAPSGRLPVACALDPIFEYELNMRLLIKATEPWIASLDNPAIPLLGPASLIRTKLTAGDDAAWKRRCPNIKVFETPGHHLSLFESENMDAFRTTFIAATRSFYPAVGP
jgi:thioesterase domain-containing protein